MECLVCSQRIVCGRQCASVNNSDNGYGGLHKKIERGTIILICRAALGITALVRYDSLPQAWQDLLVRKFGEPMRMVSKSLFEVEYRREARFFEELTQLELPKRKVDQPIHKEKFFKPIKIDSLIKTIEYFAALFEK
jgi:hypothetical protein